MFKVQNWKIGLVYAMLGTIIGLLLSPVASHREEYGSIRCTTLTIVDEEGKDRMIFKAGEVSVALCFTKDGKIVTSFGEGNYGGYVSVRGKEGSGITRMSISEYGNGVVRTYDKNGYRQ